MAGTLLLLDTASLYFRAFFGVPDTVRAPDGTPVNAIRGLLDMIATLVADHHPTRVVACWDDDWRPAFRVEAIPSYKAHRVAGPDGAEIVPEALTAQVPVIADVLAAVGVARLGAPGHEGAYDVVGLEARGAEAGNADGGEDVRDDRHLRGERLGDDLRAVGPGDAVRLVAGDGLDPEGGAPVVVPAGDDAGGVVVRDERGDHVKQPADRVHRGAVRGAHRVRDAEERTEVERGCVEQEQGAGHWPRLAAGLFRGCAPLEAADARSSRCPPPCDARSPVVENLS